MKSPIKALLQKTLQELQIKSLLASNTERGEQALKMKLESVIPDITNQYTLFKIPQDNEFLTQKVRCQHSFQVSLMLKSLEILKGHISNRPLNVVDIGDSAGSHIKYLEAIAADFGFGIKALSVNLDPEAVERIKARGLDAKVCRAEELHLGEGGVKADLFMLFEVLEHLFDPITFLRTMATKSECRHLIITVPYLRTSRVGLHHVRQAANKPMYAENTHIFELCPEDWDLLFQFAGWRVVYSDRYTQYPQKGLLHPLKYVWRKYDFDGFYGVILTQDLEISNLYQNW
jgi:hypothetical protein